MQRAKPAHAARMHALRTQHVCMHSACSTHACTPHVAHSAHALTSSLRTCPYLLAPHMQAQLAPYIKATRGQYKTDMSVQDLRPEQRSMNKVYQYAEVRGTHYRGYA